MNALLSFYQLSLESVLLIPIIVLLIFVILFWQKWLNKKMEELGKSTKNKIQRWKNYERW